MTLNNEFPKPEEIVIRTLNDPAIQLTNVHIKPDDNI